MTPVPTLSIVVPVFNEAGNVGPLYAEIHAVARAIGRPFEIIFVNDGSTDDTLASLRVAAAGDGVLRIIDLDGNFGEAAALCAGFHHARGELVATLDGDGQNDPADIPRLLECLERGGYRVVSGWRLRREERLVLRVLPSRVANALIAAVTRLPVHDNGCGLKLYRRDVVGHAALPRGFNRFMPAIFGVRPAEVAEVPVNDRRRQHGASHYGISRTLVVMRDVLALRTILADPVAGERRWAMTLATAAGVGIAGVATAHWRVTLVGAVAATLADMVRWNVRRFNHAQRHGVFRVRAEYRADVPASAAAGAA